MASLEEVKSRGVWHGYQDHRVTEENLSDDCDVRHCLGKVEEPDDRLELKKQKKRTAEYLIRFQWNYLYQINLLVGNVCVMPKNSSKFARRCTNCTD